MARPDDIQEDVRKAARQVVNVNSDLLWEDLEESEVNELVESIARAILAAEQRGEQRQRERIAQRYDDAADEFDKQAIETMSVADKLRLDTLAANHRQFADAIRHQEQSNG